MSQQPNHYSPEVTPAPMPQAQEQHYSAAPANLPQPPRQSDGITSEKYEAAIGEIMDAGIEAGEKSGAISTLISGVLGAAVAGGFSQIWKDNRNWKAAGMYAAGGLAGGAVASTVLDLFSKSKASDVKYEQLGQAIAQHEAQQGEFVHMQRNGAALEIPPQPELAMEQYQPTPEEMQQLKAMQQQAMAEMQMLANAEISADAPQEVQQLQSFAQTMIAGQELSPQQQQQAAELMERIAHNPQLQQEIEASLKPRRPREDGPTPDTVEKVAHHTETPATQVAQAESQDRVQEAASREIG